MTRDLVAVPGSWYVHADKGQAFCVIAVDETAGLLEVQHFDGDVEELSLEEWADMEIESGAPPEDYTGPLDTIQEEDLGYSVTEMSLDDWTIGLADLRPAMESWEDELADGDEDSGSEELWEHSRLEQLLAAPPELD